MNAQRFNSILLLAIALTILAILAQGFLPTKRLLLTPSPDGVYYIFSSTLTDNTQAGEWADEPNRTIRCTFPGQLPGPAFSCGINRLFTQDNPIVGLDMSGYTHLRLQVNTSDNHPRRLRLFLRNYNPGYSHPDDNNSTKFHALMLRNAELNRVTEIPLADFNVSDWWLDQYRIPRDQAQKELTNVLAMGIDFYGAAPAGEETLQLQSMELVGEWISRERWYLSILALWMLGIATYAIFRLIQLSQQTHHDIQVINSLHLDKQKLQLESDKFRRLSTVDPLTQAYNRFGIDQIMTTLMMCNLKEDATAPSFSLMVMDIDHFKRINDTHGHDLGDRILQRTAHIIQQNLRPQDFLGRWGGEEFVVILPNTHKEFALALAEKIRLVIMDTAFETQHSVQISLSFGVGERAANEEFSSTFKRVDEALYRAKAEGRNRCILAPNPDEQH